MELVLPAFECEGGFQEGLGPLIVGGDQPFVCRPCQAGPELQLRIGCLQREPQLEFSAGQDPGGSLLPGMRGGSFGLSLSAIVGLSWGCVLGWLGLW